MSEDIESSQKQHNEMLFHYEKICNEYELQVLRTIESLKLTLMKDGDQFCFLWGADLQSGISGFGETPFLAAIDFHKHLHNEKIKVRNR